MTPGLALNLALGCVLVELAWLAWQGWGRTPAPAAAAWRRLVPGAAAGLALLVAARALAGGLPPQASVPLVFYASLAAGGLAHAFDLWRRWPGRERAPLTPPPPR